MHVFVAVATVLGAENGELTGLVRSELDDDRRGASGDFLLHLELLDLQAVNAIGGITNMTVRVEVSDLLNASGFLMPVLIHPSAVVETSAKIGPGSQILAHSYVGSDAILADGVIVNTGAVVSHDCVIGNRCILTNGALLAGHVHLDDGVIISGNSVVHQFSRLGRLAMLCGISATSKDIPPFIMQQGGDNVVGINLIGMKRAGMTREQVHAVREAFRILYREGLILPAAMAKLEKELGQVDVIQEMLAFLRGCTKGINPMRGRIGQEAA